MVENMVVNVGLDDGVFGEENGVIGSKIVHVNKLIFRIEDDRITLENRNKLSKAEIFKGFEDILKEFKKLDAKGYLNDCNLRDLPVINEFLEVFTKDEEFIKGSRALEAYKWIFNTIFLNIYLITIYLLKDTLKDFKANEANIIDEEIDFKRLSDEIYEKIDSSIKEKLRKKGINILQNIYTGFDSEYTSIDARNNKLISVQMAVNTKTFLKIPKIRKYEMSILDADKNVLYELDKSSFLTIDKNNKTIERLKCSFIENSINYCITEIRRIKLSKNDNSIEIIINGLKGTNVEYAESKDFIIFAFNRTPLARYIYFDSKGKGYTFKEMITRSKRLGEPHLENTFNELISILIKISKREEIKSDEIFKNREIDGYKSEIIVEGLNEDFIIKDRKEIKGIENKENKEKKEKVCENKENKENKVCENKLGENVGEKVGEIKNKVGDLKNVGELENIGVIEKEIGDLKNVEKDGEKGTEKDSKIDSNKNSKKSKKSKKESKRGSKKGGEDVVVDLIKKGGDDVELIKKDGGEDSGEEIKKYNEKEAMEMEDSEESKIEAFEEDGEESNKKSCEKEEVIGVDEIEENVEAENEDEIEEDVEDVDVEVEVEKEKGKGPVIKERKDFMKAKSRTFMTSFSEDKISVSKTRLNYFLAHLTQADLSMMNDFNEFKDLLDIVNKSFVTLGKPILYEKSLVIIRDTMLLAPAGNRSLKSIGKLYGEAYKKIELTNENIENMGLLLKEDPALFIEYAVRDAEITLKHSNWMEDFYFRINEIGIPITLSNLGNKYVKWDWLKRNYKGYQIAGKYLLGEASTTQTPKGLMVTSNTGLALSYYVGNYKGGRNESFMYGSDDELKVYDYDLISAYTTVMAAAGHPNYKRGKIIDVKKLSSLKDRELLYSYIIIYTDFEFKNNVKYPSIPCYIDETTTVYPLKGSGILTGAEYLLAKRQGCKFKVRFIYQIPFDLSIDSPYKVILKDVQANRKKYPKGDIFNLMYKEIGNSIYGAVVRGMSDKRRFDVKSGKMLRMSGTDLSNPIIASWITGFIRSIIGESLHHISEINGKVISVTTDGFITDVAELEKLVCKDYLFSEYKKIRKDLSGDDTGYEVKHEGKGIISWSTRGQLSKDANIKATTGFQSSNYTLKELEIMFKEALAGEKNLEYVQRSLRSAKEIFKYGGHVTATFTDHKFRLVFDNRRLIVDNGENFDVSKVLLDSVPLKDITEAENLRYISKLHRTRTYSKLNNSLSGNKYKDYIDLAIRNFVKGLLSDPVKYNLNKAKLELKSYNDIIKYIKDFDDKKVFKISKSSISNLKGRNMIFKTVPRTKDTERFVNYIKVKFPEFDDKSFFQ